MSGSAMLDRALVQGGGVLTQMGGTRATLDDGASRAAPGVSDAEALAMVAHELRSPLHALALSAELLDADLDTMERQQVRTMVRGMYRKAVWLEGLLENLLCAARPGEPLVLNKRLVYLPEVLSDITPLVEPFLTQRDQRLRCRVVAPGAARQGSGSMFSHLPEVLADPRRIGQVLINLIVNASKFSPLHTPVDVRLHARHRVVRVAVSDRGMGLPESGAAPLFEPFRRGAEATQSGVEGLGLGLAISQSIVNAHGGQIGATPRPGGGATFWFELPIHATPVRGGSDGTT